MERREGPAPRAAWLLLAACALVAGGVVAGVVPRERRALASVALAGGVVALVLVLLWTGHRHRRVRVRCLDDLLALTPAAFEEEVARLLRELGYRSARRVGGSGDLAADILGEDARGRSVAVQCKRYRPASRVGSGEMQTFIGMIHVHHGVERGVYVTTSGYTAPARALAERHGIELIDGAALASLVLSLHGPGGSRPAATR